MKNAQKKLTKIIETVLNCDSCGIVAEQLAADLIARGVIVLPCEIGNDIWWIDNEACSVKREENGVTGFVVKKDEILVLDKAGNEDYIGSQYCHLTKEDAENALADMVTYCIYCKGKFCVHTRCPMRFDYCPVQNTPGVCKFEKRKCK